ncbi:hypothetical protein HDU78_007958 [Chytriomyces hyalinus]|nr:hypothetical protein HDU78_007958 [Chytriomyces hyalinus]
MIAQVFALGAVAVSSAAAVAVRRGAGPLLNGDYSLQQVSCDMSVPDATVQGLAADQCIADWYQAQDAFQFYGTKEECGTASDIKSRLSKYFTNVAAFVDTNGSDNQLFIIAGPQNSTNSNLPTEGQSCTLSYLRDSVAPTATGGAVKSHTASYVPIVTQTGAPKTAQLFTGGAVEAAVSMGAAFVAALFAF